MGKILVIKGADFSQVAISKQDLVDVIEPLKAVTGLYVSESTGVITANSNQNGYLYTVNGGDKIRMTALISPDNSGLSTFRYGLLTTSEPAVGVSAVQYAYTDAANATYSANGYVEITASESGYLMLTAFKGTIGSIIYNPVFTVKKIN